MRTKMRSCCKCRMGCRCCRDRMRPIPAGRPRQTHARPTMTITRVPLREQVHHAIIGRILREELAPGARLSDSALAGELGVSRTPVREALLRLEREGFLEVDVGRGFFVKPLSAGEVREVYPILWTLEVLALRTTLPPSRARLAAPARGCGGLARAR